MSYVSALDGMPAALPWRRANGILLSSSANRFKRCLALLGHGILLAITSSSAFAVLFIFYYIVKDAVPFFQLRGVREFLTSTMWYPSSHPPAFGALAIFVGSALVTLGAVVVAVPLGVAAAVCMSDVLPFAARQLVKPVIEILAAIPSVAFGFFALVVFAPLLQDHGGRMLSAAVWLIGGPIAILGTVILGELISVRIPQRLRRSGSVLVLAALAVLSLGGVAWLSHAMSRIGISSGTNALNVSIILGIMAIPTVISVSEDALQAVGRELREGCYALGATRAETLVGVVIPAAGSGICAAIILGIMRAIGETMVVWMASGNAAQIPSPWFNLTAPIRTLTATIAGDMGEADHVTGSARYHVLFAMALSLLVVSFACNLASEWVMRRSRAKAR